MTALYPRRACDQFVLKALVISLTVVMLDVLYAALPEIIAPFNAPFGFPLKQQIDSCHVDEPVLTQVRGLASYVIPKIDVQVSTAFRSVPGTFTSLINEGTTGSNGFSLNAVYTPTPAELQAALGRPSSCALCQYNLLLPGQMYSPRLTYIDFRAGYILKLGRTRALIAMDLYNLFNSQHRHRSAAELRHQLPGSNRHSERASERAAGAL